MKKCGGHLTTLPRPRLPTFRRFQTLLPQALRRTYTTLSLLSQGFQPYPYSHILLHTLQTQQPRTSYPKPYSHTAFSLPRKLYSHNTFRNSLRHAYISAIHTRRNAVTTHPYTHLQNTHIPCPLEIIAI